MEKKTRVSYREISRSLPKVNRDSVKHPSLDETPAQACAPKGLDFATERKPTNLTAGAGVEPVLVQRELEFLLAFVSGLRC
jgi:hypothetical protein